MFFFPTFLPPDLSQTYDSPILQTHPLNLASKHARAGRGVRLLPGIQIVQDTRIGRLVGPRQRHTRRRLVRAAAYNVDLRTLHVELGALGRRRGMQRDQLTAQKVLPWCDALGDCDCLHAFVGDEAVDAPF